MPGLVLGETSSCSNPVLPFFYQEEGFLKDIFSLRFSVYGIGSSSVLYEHVNDMRPCDQGGTRKDLGFYFAPLDPATIGLSVGPHEIVWRYKVTNVSDEQTASYAFEILDAKHFRTGTKFNSYVTSDIEVLSDYAVEERQKALDTASRMVEKLTGRFFFPKFTTFKFSVRPQSTQIWIDQPIIGVGLLQAESANFYDSPTVFDLSPEFVRVFNRHLQNMLSPDDRDNPKIALFTAQGMNSYSDLIAYFPEGVKNVAVTGAFGYTDPDGSPFGEIPRPLQDVVVGLAYRRLQDPTGTDPMLQSAGRVKMAKTRDQQIQFDTSKTANEESMTGDPRLDEILMGYVRPPHVGVAG